MAIDGSEQILAIRRPGRASGAEFVAAIRKVAVRHLPRGAAFAIDNEDLHVAGFEIPRSIETIDQTIVGGGRISPLCAGGRGGQIGDVRAFSRNESREGGRFSGRRTSGGVGGLLRL